MATVKDIGTLTKMRIKFLKEIFKIVHDRDDAKIEQALTKYFRKVYMSKQFVSWLAVNKGVVIGTSGLCFYSLPPSHKNPTGEVAYIINMFVEPEYRRKGIATVLFKKIVEEAKARGYKKIVLHATSDGRPLYTKFGFEAKNDEMVKWV